MLTDDGFIQNALSGKCIDVQGRPGTKNEAKRQLWDCEFSGVGRMVTRLIRDGSCSDSFTVCIVEVNDDQKE
jgi:hypothetical protein